MTGRGGPPGGDTAEIQVEIDAGQYALLVSLHLPPGGGEDLVRDARRTRASDYLLAGPHAHFENLAGGLAFEANHETHRPRARRLHEIADLVEAFIAGSYAR